MARYYLLMDFKSQRMLFQHDFNQTENNFPLLLIFFAPSKICFELYFLDFGLKQSNATDIYWCIKMSLTGQNIIKQSKLNKTVDFSELYCKYMNEPYWPLRNKSNFSDPHWPLYYFLPVPQKVLIQTEKAFNVFLDYVILYIV